MVVLKIKNKNLFINKNTSSGLENDVNRATTYLTEMSAKNSLDAHLTGITLERYGYTRDDVEIKPVKLILL